MIWFLILCGAAAVWTARAYLVPFAPCRWCQGRKSNHFSNRKRFGPCSRCKGTGSRQVAGSKTVRKSVDAALKGAGWKKG